MIKVSQTIHLGMTFVRVQIVPDNNIKTPAMRGFKAPPTTCC